MPLSDNVRPDAGRRDDVRALLNKLEEQLLSMKSLVETDKVVAHISVEAPLGEFDNVVTENITVNNDLNVERVLTNIVDTNILKTGVIISHPTEVRQSATYSGESIRVAKLSDNNLVGTLYISGTDSAGNVMFRALVDFSEKFATVYYDQVTNTELGTKTIEAFSTFKLGTDTVLYMSLGPLATGLTLWGWGFNIDILNDNLAPDPTKITYSVFTPNPYGFSASNELTLNANSWLTSANGEKLLRYNAATQTIEAGPYPFLFTGPAAYVGTQDEPHRVVTKGEAESIAAQYANGENRGVYYFWNEAQEQADAVSGIQAADIPAGLLDGDQVYSAFYCESPIVPGEWDTFEMVGTYVAASNTITWAEPTQMVPVPASGDWLVALKMLNEPLEGGSFAQGKVYYSNNDWIEISDAGASADEQDVTLDNQGNITFKRRVQGSDTVLNRVDGSDIAYDENSTINEQIQNIYNKFSNLSIIVPASTQVFATLGDCVAWMNTNMSEGTINLGQTVITINAANGGNLFIPKDKNVVFTINGQIDTITSEADQLQINGGQFAFVCQNGAAKTKLVQCILSDNSNLAAGSVELNGCQCAFTLSVNNDCNAKLTGAGTYTNILVNDGSIVTLGTNSTAQVTSFTGNGIIIKAMDLS